MKNIIKEVAKAHGISEQEVRNEMRVAIRAAMKNTDPTAQAFWKQIAPDGKEPPVERVIASISLMVQENSYVVEVQSHLFFNITNSWYRDCLKAKKCEIAVIVLKIREKYAILIQA